MNTKELEEQRKKWREFIKKNEEKLNKQGLGIEELGRLGHA